MDWSWWWVLGLRVLGVVLAVEGAAHALLPRVLGWTPDTARADGRLTWLVVRLHVGFIGAFLVLIGLSTAIGAADLVAGGALAATFAGASAVLFAARWLLEWIAVPRALRAMSASRWWWRAHWFAALFGWPVVTASYLGTAIIAAGH